MSWKLRAAGWVLVATASCAGISAGAAPPARPSVLVLGLDGAGWNVIDPLIEAGYLPQLGKLVAASARADLDCQPAHPKTACFCPPVWLSISTGVDYERHHIVFVTDTVRERRAKTVWEVLSAKGGTAAAIAWRNTWPPEASLKYVLTEEGLDWAAEQRFTRFPPDRTLRMDRAESRAKPQDLFESLKLAPYSGPKPTVNAMEARDRISMQGLLALAPRERIDLTLILLHAPDKLAHLRWDTVQKSSKSPIDEAALLAQAKAWRDAEPAARTSSVASPYLEIDAWLGELFAKVKYDYVVIASDHAMTRNDDPRALPGTHADPRAYNGVFSIAGPGVRPGTKLVDVDVFDVAPTLAWLLRLPVAQDLMGRVLLDAFDAKFVAAHPVAKVPSWEAPKPPKHRRRNMPQ
jgi:hypothetical protein